MRKTLMLVAVVAGFGMADAQTSEDSQGTYRLVGCFQIKDGVQCDLTYTLTSRDSDGYTYNAGTNIIAFTVDGLAVPASVVSVGGSKFDGAEYFEFMKGIPVKLSVQFKMPTTSTLRALKIYQGRFDNITVRGAASPTSVPVAVAAPVNTSGYNAVLTGCKAGANGALTCTATLTPRR